MIAKVDILVTKHGYQLVQSILWAQGEKWEVELARLKINDRLVVGVSTLPRAGNIDVIEESGLNPVCITVHQVFDLLTMTLTKEREVIKIRKAIKRGLLSELPTEKCRRRLQP